MSGVQLPASRFQSFQNIRTSKQELEELKSERASVESLRQEALRMRASIDTYRKETEEDREKLNKEKLAVEDLQKKTAEYYYSLEKKEKEFSKREKDIETKLSLSLKNLELSEKLYSEGMDLRRKFEIKLNRINEIAAL